jgi:hypothetical protein
MAPRKGLSFKKQPRETGLRAVGNPYPNTTIRLDGLQVGQIIAPFARSLGGDSQWKVSLMEKRGEDNFDWVTFKARFESEADARAWVIDKWDILAKRPLYQMEAE